MVKIIGREKGEALKDEEGLTTVRNFAIVMERVVKRFEDVVAVNDVSLKVFQGELFGLLGPNGAGKTTTVNMLCGLLKPTSGFVSVGGFDMQRENAEVKRLIGVCPQENAVYPYLTGVENVELFGNLYALDKETLRSRRRHEKTAKHHFGFNP